MASNLRFGSPGFQPPAGTATNLRFGGSCPESTQSALNFCGDGYQPKVGVVNLGFGLLGESTGPGTLTVVLEANLQGLTGDVRASVITEGIIAATMSPVTGAIAGTWDINVDRGPKVDIRPLYENAADGNNPWFSYPWLEGARNRPTPSTPWSQALSVNRDQTAVVKNGTRVYPTPRASWEEAAPLSPEVRTIGVDDGPRLWWTTRGRFEESAPLKFFTNSPFQNGARLYETSRQAWEEGLWLTLFKQYNYRQLGDRLGWTHSHPYEEAGLPGPGQWGGPVIPPEPPVVDPFPPQTGDQDFQFCLDLDLVRPDLIRFGINPCEIPPQPPVAIPILRVYVVANSASIVRVSDGADIAASSVSLSADIGNSMWEMSATVVGKDAAALVEGSDGAPVEVDVTVNSYTWRVLIDNWSLREAAASTVGTISGRSRSAYLTEPYVIPASGGFTGADRLMSQLADDALNLTGWTVQWNAADWLVTNGAWKYDNLTPMGQLLRLAEGAAGFVRTDRTANQIIVDPRYPEAPWSWGLATVAVDLPKDVLFQRSSQKQAGTSVNGVYVHGGNNGGVLAHVRRNGTAGTVLGPTVVDDLITDVNTAARARGIAALAATARQSVETFDMPLAASMGGLRTPGEIVAIGTGDAPFVEDYRALIKSVGIQAQAGRASNGGATLEVRQSLSLERHYGEVAPV